MTEDKEDHQLTPIAAKRSASWNWWRR